MTKTKRPGMTGAESQYWGYLMTKAINGESWMNQAACAGHPTPDIWFPSDGRGRPPKDGEPKQSELIAEAKRICSECPVQQQCRDYAVGNKERHGIWAGSGRRERREAIKQAAA